VYRTVVLRMYPGVPNV